MRLRSTHRRGIASRRPSWLRTVRTCTALGLLISCGCQQRMADQPRYEPFEASRLFDDGKSARQPIAGTVPRGALLDAAAWGPIATDASSESSEVPAELALAEPSYATRYPMPVSMDVMRRGQEGYWIYCRPCHGADGEGRGPVVRHGFPPAATLHSAELRAKPAGFFVDVITNGRAKMPGYASLIPVGDRWAIAAYVQALQFSRHAPLEELPAEVRQAGGWQ